MKYISSIALGRLVCRRLLIVAGWAGFLLPTWAMAQAPAYNSQPAQGVWTVSPGATLTFSNCGTLQGSVLRDRVTITGSTATFEVARVSGTFAAGGTVYIKDAPCGTVLASASFSKGVGSVRVAVPLTFASGTRTYVATLNSTTGDKFYTNAITITAIALTTPLVVLGNPVSPLSGIFDETDFRFSATTKGGSNSPISVAVEFQRPYGANVSEAMSLQNGQYTLTKRMWAVGTYQYRYVATQGGKPTTTNWQSLTSLPQPGLAKLGTFKVIGYVLTDWLWAVDRNHINFQKLSHLNLSFINATPKGSSDVAIGFDNFGSSITPAYIQSLRSTKGNPSLQVFVSLGGALGSGSLEGERSATFLRNYQLLLGASYPNYKPALLRNLVNFINQYGFDGIDVDLEYKATNCANYEQFIKDLRAALPSGKKLSIAIEPHAHVGVVTFPSVATMKSVDWVNMMCYNDPATDNHASMQSYQTSYALWVTQRGLPAAQTVMGLGFYGRQRAVAGAIPKGEFKFSDIVAANPANAQTDEGNANGVRWYYNGTNTITRKTKLAKGVAVDGVRFQPCGGVMIWEAGQDLHKTNPNSLLSAVFQVATTTSARVGTPDEPNVPAAFSAYPNPATGWVTFAHETPFQLVSEATGQMVLASETPVVGCDIGPLPAGTYILRTPTYPPFRLLK
jgi:GH18 family chitinase